MSAASHLERSNLPAGWRWSTVGEVTLSMKNGIYKPASAYRDDGVACLRMYNIDSGKIVWRDIKRMLVSTAEMHQFGLEAGDLLVNRVNSRELVGKAAVIPLSCEPCVFESKNIRVRVDRGAVLPEFVSFWLLLQGRRYFASNAQQVVGMASISQPQIAALPLPLPPIAEQTVIVASLEEQFSRIDAGVAALNCAQANLKRYRAAVLKAACEGRLVPTEAALARRGGRPYEPASALLERSQVAHANRPGVTRRTSLRQHPRPAVPSHLRELPEGWSWTTLGELSPADRPSAYGILQPGPHAVGGTPIVRVGDIEGGRLETGALKRVAPTVAARYPRTKLQGGEVVLTIVGTIGRAAVVPPTLTGANTARAVAVVPLCSGVHPGWVVAWLNSPAVGAALTAKAHEVARKTLNLEDVRYAEIALPPEPEQRRIIAEVDRLLSLADDLEAVVSTSGARGARLRRAVLAAAFAGPLDISARVSLDAASADSP